MITEISSSCDNRNSYVRHSDTHYVHLYSSDEPMTLDQWKSELDKLPIFGGGIKHPQFPYSYDVTLVDSAGSRVSADTGTYAAVHCTEKYLD